MTSIAAARIKREFREVVTSDELSKCKIKLEMLNENFTELKGEIGGPPDTPVNKKIFLFIFTAILDKQIKELFLIYRLF